MRRSTSPNRVTNALAGFVLGALIGALIVLALEWMAADILATPEAVERALRPAGSGRHPGDAGDGCTLRGSAQ